MKKLILAIESSCDDSSVAIIDKESLECLFHKKISQELEHFKFGGVVPELAARLHTTALPEILKQCKDYFDKLCAVAVTNEPGLTVSLLGGVTMAKLLSASLNLPLIAVNHLVGHFYSLFLNQKARLDMGVLLVSGGHTMLLYIDKKSRIKILGQSLDDAFGESFDKVAKMLKLGYPGGIFVEKLAQKARYKSLEFTVPLRQSKDLNFSFSGLKNAVRVEINNTLSMNLEKNSQASLDTKLNPKNSSTNSKEGLNLSNVSTVNSSNTSTLNSSLNSNHSSNLNSGSALNLNSTVNLSNVSTLNLNSTVNSSSDLSQNLNSNNSSNLNSSSTLNLNSTVNLSNASTLNSNLNSSNVSTVNSNLNHSSNLNSSSTSNSSENSSLNSNLSQAQKSEIAYAFEEAAVAHLMDKVKRAFKEHKFKAFGVVGGASANLRLRAQLKALCKDYGCELLLAPLEFCADNALMIARAACELYERKDFVELNEDIISPKNKHFFRV